MVGIGFSTAPARALTAEDAEFAETFLLLDLPPFFAAEDDWFSGSALATLSAWVETFFLLFAAGEAALLAAFERTGFFSPTSARSAFSAVKAFRLESTRAIASASHAALTLPRDAGRLLFHSADLRSPPICASVRLVSMEVS